MTTGVLVDDFRQIPMKKAEAFMSGFEAPAEAKRVLSSEPLATYDRAIAGGNAAMKQQFEPSFEHSTRIQSAALWFAGEHELFDEPRPVSEVDFDCWKLFDMGEEGGTVGAHLESVARECQRKRWIEVLANLNASRYGFFAVEQRQRDGTLQLRELITERTGRYVVRAGTFEPRKGQMIFTRLAAPLTPDSALGGGLTEPIQVRVSPEDLRAFFSRTYSRVGLPETPDSYEAVMKHGIGGDQMYWLRYIDRCMFHNTKEPEDAAYFKEPPDQGLFAALEEALEEIGDILGGVDMLTPRTDFAAEVLAPARAYADQLDSTLWALRDGLNEQWTDRPEVADSMVRVLAAAVRNLDRMIAELDAR